MIFSQARGNYEISLLTIEASGLSNLKLRISRFGVSHGCIGKNRTLTRGG
jgi:hypothetical protein